VVVDPLAEFVAGFSDFWRSPTPERLGELLADDVVLTQPLSAPMRGLAAAQAEFGRILAWLPDLRAEVDAWSGTGDTVFIEFRLRARIGGRPTEWPAVDRFRLRGAKAVERVSYFDGLPLVRRVLGRPRAWWGWWRSGTARPWH
jgi:ketosteroid isomerase-like protein